MNIRHLLYIVLAITLIGLGYFFWNTRDQARSLSPTLDAPTFEKFSDTNEFYTITADIPSDPRDTDKVMETFVRDMISASQKEWALGGETHLFEQQLTREMPDRPLPEYTLDIKVTSTRAVERGYDTYLITFYTFTGGAHGGTGLVTYTFDNAKYVAIDDILSFENGNDIALTKLVAERLRVELGEYADENMLMNGLGLAYLRPDGTFDSAKCGCDGFFFGSNFQTFVPSDKGITFIFQQYQVAAYAVGMPQVFFSWDDLSPYLRN